MFRFTFDKTSHQSLKIYNVELPKFAAPNYPVPSTKNLLEYLEVDYSRATNPCTVRDVSGDSADDVLASLRQ